MYRMIRTNLRNTKYVSVVFYIVCVCVCKSKTYRGGLCVRSIYFNVLRSRKYLKYINTKKSMMHKNKK